MSVLATCPWALLVLLGAPVTSWLLGKLMSHEWPVPRERPLSLVEEAEWYGREAEREGREAAMAGGDYRSVARGIVVDAGG